MGEKRHAYRVWRGNLTERDFLEDLGVRWEDDIKMDLQEVGWGGVIGLLYLRIQTSGRLL